MNGRAARARRQAEEAPAADDLSAHVQLKVVLGTGRPVLLAVPVDLTAVEALDLVGYVAKGMGTNLAQARAAAGPPSAIVRRPALIVPGR